MWKLAREFMNIISYLVIFTFNTYEMYVISKRVPFSVCNILVMTGGKYDDGRI